jgi:choline dehydrogenase
MLGGSGAMNAMFYVRGNRRDFDQWEMLGNPGWGWQNVLEYFKKSEDNQQPLVLNSGNGRFHRQGGLLKVSTPQTEHLLDQLILTAAQEIGYRSIVDFNGEEHIGYSLGQATIDSVQGLRCSPATAFLASAANRTNLHVFKNAHVTKLDFNIDGSVAGVNFMLNGQLNNLVVRPRKEVILSAGAINTPLILMLSGIGPEKNFRKLGVPLVKNLPGVGKNLQDHVWCPLLFRFRNLNNTAPVNTEEELQRFLGNRSGMFSESGISSLMGFINTADPLNPYPDIQYHYFRMPANSPTLTAMIQNYGYELSVVQSFLQANKDADVLMAMVVLLNPKSYGKIKLTGSDPLQKPRIDAGYLYMPEDVATMIRGIRHQQKLLATKTFTMAGAELYPVVVPGCQAASILPDSDGYWECYIRHMSTTLYHPSGTAKMGPDTDRDAVVDARLKVKGLPNLRVADASIMPKIVSANTNAAAIMIGEKASDLIKADWPMVAPRTEL